jgi:hypothetical protein
MGILQTLQVTRRFPLGSNKYMSSPHKPTPVEKIDLPEDPREEWVEEDIEIEGRKPDLEEIEEDKIDL